MNWLRRILRDELRAILAVVLLLLLLVGLGFAATSTWVLGFDFQGADLSALASNNRLVAPSTFFPISVPDGPIEYGWKTPVPELAALLTGGSNLGTRDGIAGSAPATFVIAGLEESNYQITVTAGSAAGPVSVAFSAGLSSAIVAAGNGEFPTRSIVAKTKAGKLEITFRPVFQTNWLVNALVVRTTPQAVTLPANFEVTIDPPTAAIQAGEEASFKVRAASREEYAYPVDLGLLTVPRGFVASLTPSQLLLLPAEATIRISASLGVPPLTYDFAVKVVGQDPAKITKTLFISLQVREGEAPPVSPPPSVTQPPVSEEPSLTLPPAVVLTPAQILADARVLAVVQQAITKAAPRSKTLSEIRFITADLRVPTVSELPNNPRDLGLDFSRNIGIVKTVVDIAPRAPAPQVKLTLWQRFMRALMGTPVR